MSALINKQPPILYILSAVCIGERFGFFLMRALLMLYMINVLSFSSLTSYQIFGTFTALLYLSPLIGGYIIDQHIDIKKSMLIGGLLLTIGYILLGITPDNIYMGLACIICGKGLFAPSLNLAVNRIYLNNDRLREGGFSILYAANNLAGILPPVIAGLLTIYFGWSIAFYISGISVLISIMTIHLISKDRLDLSRNTPHLKSLTKLILIPILCSVFIFAYLLNHTQFTSFILLIGGIIAIIYLLIDMKKDDMHLQKNLLWCFLILSNSIVFYTLSQQSAMSLTLFAEYNVNRHLLLWDIPSSFFLALNPLFICIMGPIFSVIWLKLKIPSLEFSKMIAICLGNIMTGLGFIIIPLAISLFSLPPGKINFIWLILSYFLQSIGELLICSLSMAMLTELAPKRAVGVIVGMSYFVYAISAKFAEILAIYTIPSQQNFSVVNTSTLYLNVFSILGIFSILIGILIYFVSQYLKSKKIFYDIELKRSSHKIARRLGW